jgi:hypothetical protein
MLLLVGRQQRICFAAAGSGSITLLVQKYSGSTGLITTDEMQKIIDRIRNCSSDESNIDTAHSLQRNCASNVFMCMFSFLIIIIVAVVVSKTE